MNIKIKEFFNFLSYSLVLCLFLCGFFIYFLENNLIDFLVISFTSTFLAIFFFLFNKKIKG